MQAGTRVSVSFGDGKLLQCVVSKWDAQNGGASVAALRVWTIGALCCKSRATKWRYRRASLRVARKPQSPPVGGT